MANIKKRRLSCIGFCITHIFFMLDLYSNTAEIKSATFKPDISLLNTWKKNDGNKFVFPMTQLYKKSNKELLYIAALHENSLNSATYEMIKNAIPKFNPEIIIIEGLSTAFGISPEVIKKIPQAELIQMGESFYAISIAINSDILFIGGEPSGIKIVNEINDSEYSVNDLIGYCIIREIPVWKRSEKEIDFNIRFSKYMKSLQKQFSLSSSELMDIEQFKKWYLDRNKINFDLDKITMYHAAPNNSDNALFTEKFAFFMDYIRDRHILKLIAEMLNTHNRVMIIYGAGHFVLQEPVLKKIFCSEQVLLSGIR